jgi:hypothetical protein
MLYHEFKTAPSIIISKTNPATNQSTTSSRPSLLLPTELELQPLEASANNKAQKFIKSWFELISGLIHIALTLF